MGEDWAKSTFTTKVRSPPAAGTRMASFMWRAAEGGWPNIGAHDVTQALNCTSPCFMSQIKCHDLSHGTIDQTIDLHAAAARCAAAPPPAPPVQHRQDRARVSQVKTISIPLSLLKSPSTINCDHDPLSLMSGHSKRYNCPLVRVTAAIDSSLQHSVPENIYCLVG